MWRSVLAGVFALVMAPNAAAQVAVYSGGSIHDLDPPASQRAINSDLEITLGSDDIELVSKLGQNDIIRRLGKPVGRLTIALESRKTAYCTASLIAPDLILTNYHCIPGIPGDVKMYGRVTEASLWMGYLVPSSSGAGASKYIVDIEPVESSEPLDFSILRVTGHPGDQWGTIKLSAVVPFAHQSLFIVHHPRGYAQSITRANCQTDAPPTDGDRLVHECDTEGGSSGAPIFDNETRTVIGLHYTALGRDQLNAGKSIASLVSASQRLAALVSPPPLPTGCDNIVVNVGTKDECLKPGDSFRDCPDCPEMVVLPAGEFTMGSPDGEEGRSLIEGPQRRVRIASPLVISRAEITNAQWNSCAADKICAAASGYAGKVEGMERLPAKGISWTEAKIYVAWLTEKTGQKYRLLSEAEWEYAARAGTTTPYWSGATISEAKANFDSSEEAMTILNLLHCESGSTIALVEGESLVALDGVERVVTKEDVKREQVEHGEKLKCQAKLENTRKRHLVRLKNRRPLPADPSRANPWGLIDMLGNLAEWVEDCITDYDVPGMHDDGTAFVSAEPSRFNPASCSNERVIRGGSWWSPLSEVRSAARSHAMYDKYEEYYDLHSVGDLDWWESHSGEDDIDRPNLDKEKLVRNLIRNNGIGLRVAREIH